MKMGSIIKSYDIEPELPIVTSIFLNVEIVFEFV